MKKLCISIFTMLLTTIVFSQDLPTIAPVSPEAASLGKYGDLPVNLSTGKLEYSVPIFTIDVNGFQLPISLSYNNGGLLAEEDAGVAGHGWTLNAGGRIIRQLRGKADEGDSGYLAGNIGKDWVIPYNFNLWNSLPATQREDKIKQLLTKGRDGTWDLQPDKYTMNANGLNGSFSYNEDGEEIFYPQKNYQVTKASNNYTIVNDQGITYEFNQKEMTQGEDMTTDNPNLSDYVSSWGLTKIAFPTNDKEITLSYSTNSSYTKSSFSDSRRIRTSTHGNLNACTVVSEVNTGEYVTTIANKINISSIAFPQGTVDFDIRHVSNGNGGTTSYLHVVEVKDTTGAIISKYNFEYNNINSNVKLLEKIRKYDGANNELPFYSFEYFGTPPSNINYASQDLWGFYNAKPGANLFSNDRSVDFNSARLGALKKIKYPTKGFTEITYESNRAYMVTSALQEIQEETGATIPQNKSEVINLTSSGSNSKTVTIPTDQYIKVTLITKYTSGNGYMEAEIDITSSLALDCDIYNPIGDNCQTTAQTYAESGGITGGSSNKNFVNYFYAKKNQQVTISASLVAANVVGKAYIKVEYFEPTTAEEIESYTEFVENGVSYITPKVGGIRVQTTSDCSSTGNCVNKTYKYIQSNGKTSGKLLLSSLFYSNSQEYLGSYPLNGSCRYKVTSSASKLPSASYQGAPVLYERVEVLQNGTDANGKRVLTFSNDVNASQGYPGLPIESQDWRKGNLLTETTYANKNGTLTEISKKTNTYSSSYPFASTATATKRAIGMAGGQSIFRSSNVFVLSDLNERSFNNRPELYQLTSSTEETDGIITTTNYQYDAISGYTEEKTTTNSNNITLKEKYYYPEDIPDNTLVNENRIAAPIKTETFRGTEKLATQKSIFQTFGNHYLTKKNQVAKGAQAFQDGVIYHGYYDNGNIKEVSKEDGTHIVYIWGYNGTLPIAKIEDATFSSIPTSLYNQIITASNGDVSVSTENTLRTKLEALRNHSNLSNSLVTTFTHDPLIGVTSITDPRGESIFYYYDNFNRLEYVKDAYGKIVSKNEYHYKN